MDISQIKKKLKETIAADLTNGIEAFRSVLDQGAPGYNEVMHQLGRWNSLQSAIQLKAIPHSEAEINRNEIRAALLAYVDEIEEQDYDWEDQNWELFLSNHDKDYPILSLSDSLPVILEREELKFVSKVGVGRFAEVFHCIHKYDARHIALKVFNNRFFNNGEIDEALKRFVKGAELQLEIDHHRIVKALSVSKELGYLTMEYFPEGDLENYLKRRRKIGEKLNLSVIIDFSIQICEPIEFLHNKGFIHRDLSIKNYLVCISERPEVKLTDFDLAYERWRTQLTPMQANWRLFLPEDLHQEMQVMKPKAHMLGGEVLPTRSIQVDIFAIGMIILYMIAGNISNHTSLESELSYIETQLLDDVPDSPVKLSYLITILRKIFSSDPSNRYPSVASLKHDIELLKPPVPIEENEDFVTIYSAIFYMGSDKFDEPRHLEKVEKFSIMKYPVTNEQYKKFLMDDLNAGWRKGGPLAIEYADADYLRDWCELDFPENKGNHPVVYLSWYAALAYANWNHSSLPTEAEWEYAALGGEASKYWWGNNPDPSKSNFYMSKENKSSTAVNAYPPNPFGIFDMLGNVSEWCIDDYFPAYSSRDVELLSNSKTSKKVVKGGDFESPSQQIRCSAREKTAPNKCIRTIGFRCAHKIK